MENRFFFHKNLVVRYEKVIFSLSKKFLFQGATKKIFFGFRKIAFTVRHEKAFFQGAIKILKFFFWKFFSGPHEKAIFSVSDK